MTSASVYVLTHPQTDRRSFRVLTWLVPICCAGFVAGLWRGCGGVVFAGIPSGASDLHDRSQPDHGICDQLHDE